MTKVGPRALAESMLLIVEKPGITRAQTNEMLHTTIAAPASAALVKRGLVEEQGVSEQNRLGRRVQNLYVSAGFWALQEKVTEEITADMNSSFRNVFEQAVIARNVMTSLLSFPAPEDASLIELQDRARVMGGADVLADQYKFSTQRWPFSAVEGWRLLITAQALASKPA